MWQGTVTVGTANTSNIYTNPNTRGSSPFLLKIIVILFHIALVRDKFLTTSDQSSSSTEITLPRYRKEVTISRGKEVTARSSSAAIIGIKDANTSVDGWLGVRPG